MLTNNKNKFLVALTRMIVCLPNYFSGFQMSMDDSKLYYSPYVRILLEMS